MYKSTETENENEELYTYKTPQTEKIDSTRVNNQNEKLRIYTHKIPKRRR